MTAESPGGSVGCNVLAGAFAVDASPAGEDSRVCTEFAREQYGDMSLSGAWEQARKGTHGMLVEGGLLYHEEEINGKRQRQLVLPLSRRREVLRLAHDRAVGGHLSGKKTRARIRSAFFWPTLVPDVNKYCQSCHACQIFARPRTLDRVPIAPITRPERPFEIVYLDCIGPLEPASSRGYRYALCVVDIFTRWVGRGYLLTGSDSQEHVPGTVGDICAI